MSAEMHPTFREAVRIWLKIGLLSFGGPAGQIATMHRILVEEKRWVSDARFLHALNYCMLLPGPEAMQLATYIGWLLHGLRGGLVAGILFVLPGFCVMLGLSTLYALFQGTGWLSALFFGLKAAVLAIVIQAVIRVGRQALKTHALRVIAVLAFTAIFAFDAPFPLIVLLAALAGYFGAKVWPEAFVAARHGNTNADDGGPYLALVPPHVEPGWTRAFKVIGIWAAIWAAPVQFLGALLGWNSIFMPIAVFFSKMAVVTFGGAYAVLAYVAQQAVETLGWLKPGEMLDGLAMAETTPGPLILVLTHIGFLAAYRDPGALSPLVAGVIGAGLTTWVTFVPCFLWIFLGAPYVEKLAGNRAISSALAGITAAVVGVILNLSVWFALHALFGTVKRWHLGPVNLPLPVWSSLDLWSVALSAVALFATFRLKLGMIPTLAISAVLGLCVRLVLGG